MLKKILKIFSSRLFYLFLGLFLALGVFIAQAVWINLSTVSSGQTLTATSWNEIINNLNDLNSRMGTLESGGGGSCQYMPTANTYGGGVAMCPDGYYVAGIRGPYWHQDTNVVDLYCCR